MKTANLESTSTAWRLFRVALITVSVLAVVVVAIPYVLIYGFELLPPKRQSASGNSIEVLRKAYPGLNNLDVLACSYTSVIEDSRSPIPSPHNRKSETLGWITLDASSATLFRARGTWHLVARARVPSSLRAILPTGTDFVSSDEVDRTFSKWKSEHLCRVVMPVLGDTLYFITRDIDHPFQD